MDGKKILFRKCVGCHEMKNKNDLIRIVRNNKGEFFLDYTNKKAGRGAYVCNNMECIKRADKNKGLERSFKSYVPICIYENLKKIF